MKGNNTGLKFKNKFGTDNMLSVPFVSINIKREGGNKEQKELEAMMDDVITENKEAFLELAK